MCAREQCGARGSFSASCTSKRAPAAHTANAVSTRRRDTVTLLLFRHLLSLSTMTAVGSVHDDRSRHPSWHANPSASASTTMLITLLEPMLCRVARLYESDAPTRRDLEQDMLIAIWLSLGSHEKKAALRTWARDIAHEVGAQHVARRRICRRNERLGHDLESLPNRHDTEAITTTHERALMLHGLLRKLRPREREAVLLELQEFDSGEMSDAMRISRAQVRDTLVRARCRLLKWLRRSEAHAPTANGAPRRSEQFVWNASNARRAHPQNAPRTPYVIQRTEMRNQWPRKT